MHLDKSNCLSLDLASGEAVSTYRAKPLSLICSREPATFRISKFVQYSAEIKITITIRMVKMSKNIQYAI